jgi:hypothetical protein
MARRNVKTPTLSLQTTEGEGWGTRFDFVRLNIFAGAFGEAAFFPELVPIP